MKAATLSLLISLALLVGVLTAPAATTKVSELPQTNVVDKTARAVVNIKDQAGNWKTYTAPLDAIVQGGTDALVTNTTPSTNFVLYATNIYDLDTYVSNYFQTNVFTDTYLSNYFATNIWSTNVATTNISVSNYFAGDTYVSNYFATNVYTDTYVSNYFQTNLYQTVENITTNVSYVTANRLYVTEVYQATSTITNNLGFVLWGWGGPTNVLPMWTGYMCYDTFTPCSITRAHGLSNNLVQSTLLCISNAASSNITLRIPAEWRTGDGLRAYTISNAAVGMLSVEYMPTNSAGTTPKTNAVFRLFY